MKLPALDGEKGFLLALEMVNSCFFGLLVSLSVCVWSTSSHFCTLLYENHLLLFIFTYWAHPRESGVKLFVSQDIKTKGYRRWLLLRIAS